MANKLYIYLLFVLTITWATQVHAQASEWEFYPSAALVSSHVAFQGDAVWVGGEHGLMRYHKLTGERISFFTTNSGLPGIQVTALLAASDDLLWVGTNNGLALFDGLTWTVYHTGNSSLPSNVVHALARGPSGELWVGTDQGLARLSQSAWTVYTPQNSGLPHSETRALTFDEAGVLWIGSEGTVGGLYLTSIAWFDGVRWSAIGTRRAARAFAPRENREMWVGTNGYGACVFKAYVQSRCYHVLTEVHPWGDLVSSLAVDAGGRVWAGANEGLSYWDGEDWIKVPDERWRLDGLTALAFSDDGELWAAGNGPGLKRVLDGRVETILTGDEDGILGGAAVALQGETAWVSTEKGLIAFRRGRRTFHPAPAGWGVWARAIDIDARGHLWLATHGGDGLLEYTGERWARHRPPTYQETWAWAVTAGPSGDVWIGGMGEHFSGGGVSRYADGQWSRFTSANAPFLDDRVWAVKETSDGSVWVGTSAGVLRYDAAGWESHSAQGAPDVFALHEGPDKRVWAASAHGISVFQEGTWYPEPIPHLAGEWGTNVSDVAVDAQGRVWASSVHGLSVREGGTWTTYTPQNSRLPHQDVARVFIAEDGSVWLSLFAFGIVRFKPGAEQPRWEEPGWPARGVSTDTQESSAGRLSLLKSNAPNPFWGATTVPFSISAGAHVHLSVYDLLGREVAVLTDAHLPPGDHKAKWAAEGVPAGVYLIRLEVGGQSQTRRALVIR